MKGTRNIVALVVVVSATALNLSGGGAGAQSSAKGTIKIGTILPANAPGLSLQDRADAVEAGVKGFNKRGGADGKKIEWIFCDSKGDPNTEAECAREMVDEDVVATVSDLTTANPATVNQILTDAGIARIGITPAGIPDYSSPVAFPIYAGAVGTYGANTKFIIDNGNTKVSIFTYDQAAARALPTLLEPMITEQGGQLVTTVYIPAGTTDYSQFVAQAQSAGADAGLLVLNSAEATQVFKAASQLGADMVFATSPAAWTAKEVQKLGALAKSASWGDATPPPSDSTKRWPGLKLFLADMKAFDNEYSALTAKGNQVQAWLAVNAFVGIMEDSAVTDAAGLLERTNTVTDVDMRGLMPDWTPSAKISHPIFKSISNPYVYAATFNGKVFKTAKEPIDAYALWPASG